MATKSTKKKAPKIVGLKAKKPEAVLDKALSVEWKALFKALGKGVSHTFTGKWADLAADTIEAICSLGLSTQPGELGFLLVQRSIARAIFDLIEESSPLFNAVEKQVEESSDDLAASLDSIDFELSPTLFERPAEIAILPPMREALSQWLVYQGLSVYQATAISNRLSSYFIYALQEEWRSNFNLYEPLIALVSTPFTTAAAREAGWNRYASHLQKKIEESVLGEAFSIRQIYVPLNAYYKVDVPQEPSAGHRKQGVQHVVVALKEELIKWLCNKNDPMALRVISGGPGSGKSTLTKILAADLSSEGHKVLYVELHLIDANRSVIDEVGRYVSELGLLDHNPLAIESGDYPLLVIFDGLDELAGQGKTAAESADSFIREIERLLAQRNQSSVRLRALVSGRELVVQENETDFRQKGQTLHLLPYFVEVDHGKTWVDPINLLSKDLRDDWWANYSTLTGSVATALPSELRRDELDEVTSQPLLNYLVALSFVRGKVDFKRHDVNLNEIYDDLVNAVYSRAYDGRRIFHGVRHMSFEHFERILEEVSLAAWHGDGRSTTVREIEEHCNKSGLRQMLSKFQEGAERGVTNLLAAFFFRRHGERASGERTFVFTHKTFGEYLVSKRIVRAVARVAKEITARNANGDEGWDERAAMRHWIDVCGPSSISHYLHRFICREIALHRLSELEEWQSVFEKLFENILQNSVPMEECQRRSFRLELMWARNAEEASLISLNACARASRRKFNIGDATRLGTWIRRIQSQRRGADVTVGLKCLSHSRIGPGYLFGADLASADLSFSDLSGIRGYAMFLNGAEFVEATIRNCSLPHSDLSGANLSGCNLVNVILDGVLLRRTRFRDAKLDNVSLRNIPPISLKFDCDFENAVGNRVRVDSPVKRMMQKRGFLPTGLVVPSKDEELEAIVKFTDE